MHSSPASRAQTPLDTRPDSLTSRPWALADPTRRTINIVGDNTFDVSNLTERHKLRLHNSVQVNNLTAGTVVAYNLSEVHNLIIDPEAWMSFDATGDHISGTLLVAAFDQAQVHGVTGGDVYPHGEAQVHGVTGGWVRAFDHAQVHGVANGDVIARDQVEVHNPTGGYIQHYGPDTRVYNAAPGVNVQHLP